MNNVAKYDISRSIDARPHLFKQKAIVGHRGLSCYYLYVPHIIPLLSNVVEETFIATRIE